jgi:hypothetical protein
MASPLSSIGALGGTTEQDIFKQFYPKYPKPASIAETPPSTPVADAISDAAATVDTALETPKPKSAAEEYGWTAESKPLERGRIVGGGGIGQIMWQAPTAQFLGLGSNNMLTNWTSDYRKQAAQVDAYNAALRDFLNSLNME